MTSDVIHSPLASSTQQYNNLYCCLVYKRMKSCSKNSNTWFHCTKTHQTAIRWNIDTGWLAGCWLTELLTDIRSKCHIHAILIIIVPQTRHAKGLFGKWFASLGGIHSYAAWRRGNEKYSLLKCDFMMAL